MYASYIGYWGAALTEGTPVVFWLMIIFIEKGLIEGANVWGFIFGLILWLLETLGHTFLLASIEPWALPGKPISATCKVCLPCAEDVVSCPCLCEALIAEQGLDAEDTESIKIEEKKGPFNVVEGLPDDSGDEWDTDFEYKD